MQDRVVVVTGGFGALGRAVGEAAAARGARVVLLGHGGGEAPARGLALGGVDLTDLSAVQAALAVVGDQFGRIDALLNVAGGFTWQTLEDGDLADWDRMYRLNVLTAATACKAAIPYLAASGSGRIVNVGAAGASKAAAGMGAYAAAKAGVAKLTESLAAELKGRVTVNAVLPSIIDTPQNRKDMPDADPAAWVTTAELAAVILFLASAEASGVTGALIPVVGRI
jgi:NAD(P)-dependent dehydrogenase (short-subunit alcohol dehydrogenase family)